MNRLLRPATFLLWFALGLGGASTAAHAEECPDSPPAASAVRRALAKDWFSRAEAADGANDPITAVRAYQCSLKMVPHAFTAFNLGRLAERTGDLELAVEAFDTYMKLAPEAPDRVEIQAKIAALNGRIQALRAESLPGQVATPAVPAQPSAPIEVAQPPPGEEPPGVVARTSDDDHPSSRLKLAPWIVGGVGVAALAAGIGLNVSARGKMSDCRSLADAGQIKSAEAACDAAGPRAYTSYALFGVAAAAAITEGVLLFVLKDPTPTERAVSATPLPGGGAIYGRFRF